MPKFLIRVTVSRLMEAENAKEAENFAEGWAASISGGGESISTSVIRIDELHLFKKH